MPSGLAQTMSQGDLVDLVEFLALLKKPNASIQPTAESSGRARLTENAQDK